MKPQVEYLQGSNRMQSQQGSQQKQSIREWKTISTKMQEVLVAKNGKNFTLTAEEKAPVFDNGNMGSARLSLRLTKAASYLYLTEEEGKWLVAQLRKFFGIQ